jgi:hypothetical protein
MDMEPFADLKKAFRSTTLASGAVIVTLFIYAVIVEVIKSELKPFTGFLLMADKQVLRYLSYGLAILVVVLTRILGRTWLKGNPGEAPQVFIQKLSRAAVLTAVLAEVPAVLGFVFFLLTGAARDFYYLLFVSLFLEFMYFPRTKTWVEMIKNTYPQAKF